MMSALKQLRKARGLFLLCFTFIIALHSLPAMAQTCLHDGDVNQDGHLTPADALLTFQQFLGIVNPSLDSCQQTRANVDDPQSSGITPADALCIFQRFLGLESCLTEAETSIRLVEVGGNNQVVVAGEALHEPLVVRVEDQFGNPQAGVEVTAEIIQGDAEFIIPETPLTRLRSLSALSVQATGSKTAVAVTDALGEARFFLRAGLSTEAIVVQISAGDRVIEFQAFFLASPEYVAVETDGRLVVTDASLRAIVRVDPVSGNRTIVTEVRDDINMGVPFIRARGLAVEMEGDLVVVDSELRAVIRVDPVTGKRTIVSR